VQNKNHFLNEMEKDNAQVLSFFVLGALQLAPPLGGGIREGPIATPFINKSPFFVGIFKKINLHDC
jgi:hypothetical protein